MIRSIFGFVGDVVDTVATVATFPIAVALGVSESLVKRAVVAGCRTEREVLRWIKENE